MSIQEFSRRIKAEWQTAYRNRSASEVLLGPMPEINWPETFKKAGYIPHHINTIKSWREMHTWCIDKFGEEHYSWTGSVFWFENKEDATLFVLRWS